MRSISFMAAVAVLLSPIVVCAQAINVDFGFPLGGVDADYRGAGLPGVWNSIEGEETPFWDPEIIYDLVGLDGQDTGVTVYQFGGTETVIDDDPSVTGDDAVLMRDGILTHTQNLEVCLWVNGLDPGLYEVITYAWRPNNPNIVGRVRLDFVGEIKDVGGEWSGEHVEGVTYARHVVSAPNGFIGLHVGNAQGNNLGIGAMNNGFQLRPLISEVVGDLNGDQTVDAADHSVFGACLAGPDVTESPDGCSVVEFDNADLDRDLDVDLDDYRAFDQLATQ